eukprot:CAMPEP_0194041900 /NCGR_PEP_ID=MMETSP0009_2-20130614/13701_1 /TAXON_ID=210454 /ORGANISM="Grammatophora oceanica, Strain CCMP 410" /LENGTH=852 /DNA_ID=CAMNT_0038685531 /DNA_START=114 /DNA_END=2672 /DNA_ORIENTATION=+
MFHHDVDRPWASRVPDDDEEWDSADSGASASRRHRKTKKKSKNHQSRRSKKSNNDMVEMDDEMKPHRFVHQAVEWFDNLGTSPNDQGRGPASSPTLVDTPQISATTTPRIHPDEMPDPIQDRDQSPSKNSATSPLRTPPRSKKSSSKRQAASTTEPPISQGGPSAISPLVTPPRDSPLRRNRPSSRQAKEAQTSSTSEIAAAPVEQKIPDTIAKSAATTIDAENVSSASSGDQIPRNYIETIQKAFGKKADLYNDVLQVSMHSHPRDVRIAYFRRGREVLTDGDITGKLEDDSPQSISLAVSESAKLKFQAVSMAYEILSDPGWRKTYDSNGLEVREDSITAETDSTPTPVKRAIPVLRTSKSAESRVSKRKSGGVTWNEEVEELVFDDKTDTITADDSSSESSKQRKSKKKKKKKEKRGKKKRIILETDELQRHLEKLDREAERHFVSDFLDDLETGMEELLSLGSSKKGELDRETKKKKQTPAKENSGTAVDTPAAESKSVDKVKPSPKRPPGSPGGSKTDNTFDSKFMNDVDDSFPVHPRALASPGAKERVRSDVDQRVQDALKVDAERRAKKEQDTTVYSPDSRRKGTVDELQIPTPNGRRKGPLFVAPNDILVKKSRRSREIDDGQGTVSTHDDTISTISSSVVDKRARAVKVPQTIRKIVPLGRLNEERTKSDNESDETSKDSIYEPDASVEPKRVSGNKSVDTRSTERSTEMDGRICERDGVICGLDLTENDGCGSSERRRSSPRSRTSSRSSDPTDDASKSRQFHHHLLGYLNSMVNEVEYWTSSSWKSTTGYMQQVMVTESDLDGMMGIVRKEMDTVPQAFKSDEQQKKKSNRPIPKVVKTST